VIAGNPVLRHPILPDRKFPSVEFSTNRFLQPFEDALKEMVAAAAGEPYAEEKSARGTA
jgi:hypothetical protein